MKELTGSELGGHIKVENYWIFYIEKIILKIVIFQKNGCFLQQEQEIVEEKI